MTLLRDRQPCSSHRELLDHRTALEHVYLSLLSSSARCNLVAYMHGTLRPVSEVADMEGPAGTCWSLHQSSFPAQPTSLRGFFPCLVKAGSVGLLKRLLNTLLQPMSRTRFTKCAFLNGQQFCISTFRCSCIRSWSHRKNGQPETSRSRLHGSTLCEQHF